jgi:iduronate 2-sulfatase
MIPEISMYRVLFFALFTFSAASLSAADKPPNVLFLISDDLTYTALSCYGNTICKTPNIDKLAAQGTRFTRAYCQATYCGPSRASFMFGYYPHATQSFNYSSGRKAVGDERASWAEHFKNNGYHTARVSKIFHMGVPGGIEQGSDGADDPASWVEKYNSKGPEWKAKGSGETLQISRYRKKTKPALKPNDIRPPMGGNTFVVVEADGDDMVHSDGKTAAKAVELLNRYKSLDKPFFLGVGFARPHIPFVAPRKYFEPYLPYSKLPLPEKVKGDWDDIPKQGINYCTSSNMKMDERRQRKAVGGYYASVSFMDAQVGKILDALDESGMRDNTIVIFTSDHGFHLGEHDFWAKVSVHEESAGVPLIISAPGKKPAVCHSFAELLDLYPTISSMCGLEVPSRLQGKNIAPMLDDPTVVVRDAALCTQANSFGKGFLLRDKRWAYIQYGEPQTKAIELFDMKKDPKQYTNQANNPEYAPVVADMKKRMAAKLAELRINDLGKTY